MQSLRPVLKVIKSSCSHDESDKFCIDDYLAVERDAGSDRNSINENFEVSFISGVVHHIIIGHYSFFLP